MAINMKRRRRLDSRAISDGDASGISDEGHKRPSIHEAIETMIVCIQLCRGGRVR